MPLHGEAARPTYVIQGQVPTGPGRAVYQAWHHIFNGPCMQKTVNLIGLPDAMFLSEPQLLQHLAHRHIVEVREAQYDPANPALVTYVMPYYPGGSAQDGLLTGDRYSVDQSLRLAGHLLDGLAHLHSHGFIHRDVKPANLLLDASKRTGYLSDLGSAGRMDASGRVATAGFTQPYLDPSSWPPGAGVMTVRSDVYAAGLTLFELLSGTLLPKFDPAKATTRQAQGKRAYPDSALTYAPHVPAPVRRALNKAIAVDPAQRYASAADMATALARASRRVVDWVHTSTTATEDEWHGTWPPSREPADRRTYRVTSRAVLRGPSAGSRRLEASYLAGPTTWRRFGGLILDVPAGDSARTSKFFDTVDAAVAQIRAAR